MASACLHLIVSATLTDEMFELAGHLVAAAEANCGVNLRVYSPQMYEPTLRYQKLNNLVSLTQNSSSVKVVQVETNRSDIFRDKKNLEFQRMIEGFIKEEKQPIAGHDWILSDPSLPWIKETADKYQMPLFSVSSATGSSSMEPQYHLELYPLPPEVVVNRRFSSSIPISPPRFSLQEICKEVVSKMNSSSRHTTTLPANPDSTNHLQEEKLLNGQLLLFFLLLRKCRADNFKVVSPQTTTLPAGPYSPNPLQEEEEEVRFFVVIVTGSNSVAAKIGRLLERRGETVEEFSVTGDPTPSRALHFRIQWALKRGPTGIIADRSNYWIVETALISRIPLFSVCKSSSLDLNYVLVHHKPQMPTISSGELAAGPNGSDSRTVPSDVTFDWEFTLTSLCTYIFNGGIPSEGFQDPPQIEEDEERAAPASPPQSSVGEDHLLEELVDAVDHIEAENQAVDHIEAENQVEAPPAAEAPPVDAGTLAAINGLRMFMEERHLELLGEVHAIPPEVSLAVGLLHREKTAIMKLNKLIMFIVLPLMLVIFSSNVWIIWNNSGHEDKV